MCVFLLYFFFFNDTATTEIYTLSLHDALPILTARPCSEEGCPRAREPDRVANALERKLSPARGRTPRQARKPRTRSDCPGRRSWRCGLPRRSRLRAP